MGLKNAGGSGCPLPPLSSATGSMDYTHIHSCISPNLDEKTDIASNRGHGLTAYSNASQLCGWCAISQATFHAASLWVQWYYPCACTLALDTPLLFTCMEVDGRHTERLGSSLPMKPYTLHGLYHTSIHATHTHGKHRTHILGTYLVKVRGPPPPHLVPENPGTHQPQVLGQVCCVLLPHSGQSSFLCHVVCRMICFGLWGSNICPDPMAFLSIFISFATFSRHLI